MAERGAKRARRERAPAARNRTRLTLDQLRVFVAVAEREHLTHAADALNLSQGSVSAQIRRLEEALGVPLLHRVGRNVKLTDIGRAVHRRALGVLESAYALEDVGVGYMAETRGELAVAAGHVIAAHRLSTWLGPFVREHPLVDVSIALAPMQQAVESLSDGAADVVILGAGITSPAFETIDLERTELVIVVAADHPLAARGRSSGDFSEHRHLAHEHGSATQLHAAGVLGHSADLSPTVELEEGALLAALHTGLGFAVMPRAVVEQDVAAGRLVVLARRGRPVPVVFTAVRRRGPHTPVVDAFWSHLRSLAAPEVSAAAAGRRR